MLNKELENTLNTAFKQARDKHHEFMTVEHLLLALPVAGRAENPESVVFPDHHWVAVRVWFH